MIEKNQILEEELPKTLDEYFEKERSINIINAPLHLKFTSKPVNDKLFKVSRKYFDDLLNVENFEVTELK